MLLKAVVFEGLNKLVLRDVPMPEIDNDFGVLVKVKACAVCGSDIRIWKRGNDRVSPPQILGHEIAGEVVKVGARINWLRPGDRIAIGADIPCGECSFCREGHSNRCATNYAMGYQFPGGFAEYVALNSITVQYGPVHRIPDGISFEEAALAEPLGCCINGLELTPVRMGDTVVIIGAGPIGLMLSELAYLLGATKIIVANRTADRLEAAKKFKADYLVETNTQDLCEEVMRLTNGMGAELVIVACSSLDAQRQALEIVKTGGAVNFFGGLPRTEGPLEVSTNLIHYKEILVTGSHGSLPRHHRLALDLIGGKRINVADLITHTYALEDYAQAFAVADSKQGGRVIITP